MLNRQFAYRAGNQSGKPTKDRISTGVDKEKTGGLQKDFLPKWVKRTSGILKTIKIKVIGTGAGDLALFCRQFATMLDSGMPVMQCLDILQRQATNTSLAEAVRGTISLLNRGWPLSAASEQYPSVFPPVYTSMVKAGEMSGSLDQVMERLAQHFEKEYEIREKIKTALVYPLFIAATSVAAITCMLFFVLPEFSSVLESYGAGLPPATLMAIKSAGFIRENLVYLFLTAVFSYQLARVACSTHRGRVIADRVKLRLPVTGRLAKYVIIARFARALSTMLSSGVPLLQALKTVKKITCNTEVESVIAWASERAETGYDIAGAIEYSEVFPPMVSRMVAVGEKSGSLEKMLEKIADYYEKEVQNLVNRLTSLLEPLLILVMGFIVGFLILSTILPVFSIMGTIE